MSSSSGALIKRCPRCNSERPLTEVLCRNIVNDAPCNWSLVDIPPQPPGSQDAGALGQGDDARGSETAPHLCPNGHATTEGDLLCNICGAVLGEESVGSETSEQTDTPTVINGWTLTDEVSTTHAVRCRYMAQHEDGRRGLLTIYNAEGAEPDPDVYEELNRLSLDHVPEIYEVGRHENQAYEVTEVMPLGNLDDLVVASSEQSNLRIIAYEIANALRDFNRVGLRHRDLRPHAILTRTSDPLDLVINGFGSAQLSEHDLETVAPLEQTRYMAPEVVAGAVSPASDWWSLGIMLLEKATGGACFEGISDQAFLIHSMAHGVSIPERLDQDVALLLRGLLVRDHQARWKWAEFERWHQGDPLEPPREQQTVETDAGQAIQLGETAVRRPSHYALAAAKAENWDDAITQLTRGELLTWLEDIEAPGQTRVRIRAINNKDLTDDVKLTIALNYLNPNMPLVYRGDIVSPGWLIKKENINAGHALLSGDAPDLLSGVEGAKWLLQLKARSNAVRDRAKNHNIELDEEALKVLDLSSSRANLASQWTLKRQSFPDTDHPALAAIMDRRQLTEEDLILLLGASSHQLMDSGEVIEQTVTLAKNARIETFDPDSARDFLRSYTRVELMRLIDERTADFARCGNATIDNWVDDFRVQRRMSLPRAIVTLSVAENLWQIPQSQVYVQQIISFFENKLTYSIKRGPLARMTLSRTATKIDLTEFESPSISAKAILSSIIGKVENQQRFDPHVFVNDPELERRLHRLHNHALLYRRDTGIDGLYLGFPFVVFSPSGTTILPRIAPILLWPITLSVQPGRRDVHAIAFDSERDEIRLNPALESFLGEETIEDWRRRLDSLMHGSLDMATILAEFAHDFECISEDLEHLPPASVSLPRGTGKIACSAVLFHVTYMGQAIVEDLKALKSKQPDGSALAALLRLTENADPDDGVHTYPETERYFIVDSDPTQDEAVFAARNGSGLVIEGPPGTGKSQTIVNLIGDAIGQKKPVAVVCQKQAALEVVKKRLIAEGLDDRLVLITDLNKDRRRVLMDIRTQLEALENFTAPLRLENQRNICAQRIEAIEHELAEHHQSLHKHDEQAGASYRELIGELIHLESGARPAIENFQIRNALKDCTREDLVRIEDEIAPIAADWLLAEYEDSPLEPLKLFQWDDSTVNAFTQTYSEFANAESARVNQHLTKTPNFETDQPESLTAWMKEHESEFLNLEAGPRSILKLWSQLFYRDGGETNEGKVTITSLQKMLQHLDEANTADHNEDFHTLIWMETEAETRKRAADAARATKRVGFFGRLNPLRWIARRRTWKFIRNKGEVIDENRLCAFLASANLELHIKATRSQARQLAGYLLLRDVDKGQQHADLEGLRQSISAIEADLHDANLEQLRRLTNELLRGLSFTSNLIGKLLQCPVHAEAVAAANNQDSFTRFISSCRIIEERHALERTSLQRLIDLSTWMTETWIADKRDEIVSRNDTRESLACISRCFNIVGHYQRFRARSRNLSDTAWKILALLRKSEADLRDLDNSGIADEVRRLFHREIRLAWKARIESEDPALLMTQSDIDAKVEMLQTSDQEIRHLNKQMLSNNIDVSRIGNKKQWEDITRLHGARARRLREFMERGSDIGLMELRPVWLMNPDVASRLLPLKSSMFDLIVYDEASQMPIEYALPTLYRGKTVVVSGDEKQLPPTSFFHSKVESDEAEIFDGELPDEDLSEEELEEYEETWNRREIKDCPDLLALARTSVTSKMLQVHYRSEYRELIEFSNSAFYGNSLNVPARHPDHKIKSVRPIEVEHVGGTYIDQTNPDEADRIVDILAAYWDAETNDRLSIGVVSFNRKQADLIEEKISARADADLEFRDAYDQELVRVEDGQDMSFFVKNVENVQGDERDIILFSTTFGRNSAGSFRRNFGVLGQKGGERRLNVAVTRARRKVIIVTSMPISEISDMLQGRDRPTKPRDFLQSYLQYASLISAGELETGRGLLKHLNSAHSVPKNEGRFVQDGFLSAVGQFIEELGLEPDRADDGTAFGLDYAIPHPEHGQYGIGIECDAPRHNILASARARELWRPQVLARAIPNIHRVSSHGWYHNRMQEQDKLAKAINAALAEAAE